MDGGVGDDKSMDLSGMPDDLDGITSHRPVGGTRRTRFQPKLKGKIQAEPSAETAQLPPLSLVKKEEPTLEEDGVIMVKTDEPPSQDPSIAVPDTLDNAVEPEPYSMEIDDEPEDTVVRELDVFFTPSPLDDDASLYVMQYPLRPSWRPYELNERCEEVRVKAKQSKLEVDLNIDADSENYDPDVADNLGIKKQTLSSSKAPFLTDYAIGVMLGNKLHLNPVHAVVQLRPLHVGELEKKKHYIHKQEANTMSAEEKREDPLKQSTRQQGNQVAENLKENVDDTEPWVSLEYHATDSSLSGLYQQKMMKEDDNNIGFTMKPSDYVNSLCPSDKIVKVRNRRVLLSMPLEERLKMWLSEVQVNRFAVLEHLAPSTSEEDILEVLTRYAVLVQGLWVSKSSLLSFLYEGRDARVRDYILFLFNENHTISKDKLKGLKISDDSLRNILKPLAVERPKLNDWKFREIADNLFKRRHPKIVEEQEHSWSSHESDLMDLKRGPVMIRNSQNSILPKRVTVSGKVDLSASRSKDGAGSSTSTNMSSEAQDVLPKALLKLFQLQKVHSLNSITREIKKSSLLKEDQKTRIFVSAANGESASSPELKSLISQHAVDIHGVYVLKSVGNPALDQLRNVVIGLFRKKKPNSKLEKQEIEQAAKSLKRDISDSEYNQVLNEFCSNVKGSWVIKSVD